MKKISLSIDFLGIKVDFETDSSLLIRMLEKYHPLCLDSYSVDIPIPIKMWSVDNKFIVEDIIGDRSYFFDEENKAVTFCGNLFLGICAGRLQPRFSMFHAAAVCLDGEAFIFLGDSGAGKTTLALSLLKENFKLLCDDLSIVDLNTNFISLLRRKISIDRNSPFANLFAPEMFDHSWNGSKIYVDLEDIFSEHHWGVPSRLKSIFFLEESNGKFPKIEPLTQYEGLRRLCPFYIYGKRDLKMIVEQNCKIIKNTACYLVRRGDVDATLQLIKETLLEEVKC